MELQLRDQITYQGYSISRVELPNSIKLLVKERNWTELDRAIRTETEPGGAIFRELLKYAEFSEIEFIISIRSSLMGPDEDGIWHDDGSRLLAFSLSLTLDHLAVEGGKLGIRKRGSESAEFQELATPPFGTMLVFATGYHDYEHKIHRVVQGERIIIAGWCT